MNKSLKEILIPFVLFTILISFTIFKIRTPDIWLHIKAGQTILESGFVYKDTFSFTANGRDWIYHEWLFGIIVYSVHQIAGVYGLILMKTGIVLLTFLIIYRTMLIKGVNQYLASFILLIASLAARGRLVERPHIFKYLFIVSFIYILELYRFKKVNKLYLLPLIQLSWANIHGSFLLGPAIVGIYLAGLTVQPVIDILTNKITLLRDLSNPPFSIDWSKQEILIIASLLVIVSGVSLINPYGLNIIPFALNFDQHKTLSYLFEWYPTTLSDFYGTFGLLFLVGLASFIVKYKNIDIIDALIFGLFIFLALRFRRFQSLFSLSVASIIGSNLQFLFSRFALNKLKRCLLWASCLISLIVLVNHEFKKHPYFIFGFGISPEVPQKAVDFLETIEIQGNMYNSYDFGGYLIWRLYPKRKVFVDGRIDIYDPIFIRDFISEPSPTNWYDAINYYDINYAIIQNKYDFDVIGKWISLEPSKWVLIYFDEAASIYIRKDDRNREIIDKYGHRVILNPFKFDQEAIKEALNNGLGDRLETELKRNLASNPENTWALSRLGLLYYATGRKEEALDVWKREVEVYPRKEAFIGIGNILLGVSP